MAGCQSLRLTLRHKYRTARRTKLDGDVSLYRRVRLVPVDIEIFNSILVNAGGTTI